MQNMRITLFLIILGLLTGCTAFDGRRNILAKISCPFFSVELSTAVNGAYNESTQGSTAGESNLVAEPLASPTPVSVPLQYGTPAKPQPPAAPAEPAAPGK
jgi:hypothetical protein